jgi:hypothetical protein
VTYTSEKHVEAGDNVLPCAVQETDDLFIEDSNVETDNVYDEEEQVAVCKPTAMCSKGK